MSYSFNLTPSPFSRYPWRTTVCGSLLLGTLVGCAGTMEQPVLAEPPQISRAPSAPAPAQAPEQETGQSRETTPPAPEVIDQAPRMADAENNDSPLTPENRPSESDRDTDMTVLVLDNPELMAKSAAMNNLATLNEQPEESPRRPHRTRFHYGFDSHRLSDEDRRILLEHAAYLKAHPEESVRVHGHTDNFGPDEYNTFLARMRANAAAKLLREEGVKASQVEVLAWGSEKPLTNPEDHAANRRLELEYGTGQMAKMQ